MSTHNVCFCGEVRKNINTFGLKKHLIKSCEKYIIATDKRGIHIIFFLFLDEYICCGYSLEAPRRGASNEYPQHMFSLRNKNVISIF